MPVGQLSSKDFADKIRAAHPEYKDISDDDLTKAYIGKHPEYKDIIQTGPKFEGSIKALPTGKPDSEPQSEPDTYWGGFGKSIKDQVGAGINKLPAALDSVAHPKTAGDLLPLLIPSAIGEGAAGASELFSRTKNALRAGARDTEPGIFGKLSLPAKAYRRFEEALPSSMERDIEKFRGPKVEPTGPTSLDITANQKPSGYDPLDSFREKPKGSAKGSSKSSPKGSSKPASEPTIGPVESVDATTGEVKPQQAQQQEQTIKPVEAEQGSYDKPVPYAGFKPAFDPKKLFPSKVGPIDSRINGLPPQEIAPIKPTTLSDRQNELLAKFGGKQTDTPIGPVGDVKSQTPVDVNVDGKTLRLDNGKVYQLDNNGNPIGLEAPNTFVKPRTAGSVFSLYPNFQGGKLPD